MWIGAPIEGHAPVPAVEAGANSGRELNAYRMGRSSRVVRVDLNEIDDQLMRLIVVQPQSKCPRNRLIAVVKKPREGTYCSEL
jgi:hypothetical protein